MLNSSTTILSRLIIILAIWMFVLDHYPNAEATPVDGHSRRVARQADGGDDEPGLIRRILNLVLSFTGLDDIGRKGSQILSLVKWIFNALRGGAS